LVAHKDADAVLAQPLAVVTVGGVRALHGVAEIAQDLGEAAHADTADPDEMDGSNLARQSHGGSCTPPHPRAWPGHPRIFLPSCKTWMRRHSVYRVPFFLKDQVGYIRLDVTSPAMTPKQ